MSVNRDTSGYIVNNSQGKIHTQNADLLSLLTENSSDSLTQKSTFTDTHRSKRNSKTPLDANNNSQSAQSSSLEEDSESVCSQSQTSQVVSYKQDYPQPKPSALLPSSRAPSTDIKDTGRSSSTSVYAVANPDILRASGLTPTQPNQFFPRYVSLKSRSQESQLTSAAVAEEEETTPTPKSNSASPTPQSDSVSPTPRSNTESPTPRTKSVSPTKASVPVSVQSGSKSIHFPDSLEFTETDLEKHLTPLSPDPEAESQDQDPSPTKTPSVFVQENTFDDTPKHKDRVEIDKNLLQVPVRQSSPKFKAQNRESPVFEQDSLSSSVSAEEVGRTGRSADSANSSRSKVFLLRNESQNTMSGARNRKVYVESPAFTRDEEDEFRFVSSRVDDYHDMSDTYRQLDESTVEHKSKKKSSGKHVRYQDSDRFEDKNQLDLEEDARAAHRSSQGHDVTYKSALRNPNRQESVLNPVKGLVLPDKPTFDPRDAEELDRESKYQDVLKQRIYQSRQTLESAEIPKLPLSPDTDHDFMRDSLDMAADNYREGRGSGPRDSMELYQGESDRGVAPRYGQMENTTWRNPPPQPFSAPPFEAEKEDVGGQFHRQNAVDGYTSETDYRNQQQRDDYPEPPSEPTIYPQDHQGYQKHPNQLSGRTYQAQPQYYEPSPQGHRDYPHQQQFPTSGYYDNNQGYPQQNPHISSFLPEDRIHQSYDSESSYRPQYNEYDQTNPNGDYMYYDGANGGPENGQYDNRPELRGGYPNQNRADRYVNENVEPKMEMSSPLRPMYDYVTNNRFDYGRQPPKSYKQIRDIKREEKSKLEKIFIKPKVKPKHDAAGQSSARTVNSLDGAEAYHSPRSLNQKPASAEDLWAQRAAKLQQRSAGRQGTKKKPGSKLVKYPSDSGLSANPKVPLPRPAFLPQAVNSGPHNNYTSPPHSFPSSPQRRPLELKPISQEVITSDGQRISVDVNLKLMSPPPAHHHSDGYLNKQAYVQDVTDPVGQVGHQYPIMDHYNQQDYGENYSDANSGISTEQPGYDNLPKDVRQLGNAYPKIPPIPSSGESKQSHQQSEVSDGYVAQFRKQRDKKLQEEPPWYKVYNISDYRKMQKEVQLGTLGPDLDNDSFRDRMEKMQRQTQYARLVQERNKQEIIHKKPPSFPKPKDQDDIMNKRRLALEYAKNVPKPSVKVQPNPYNSYQVASQMGSSQPNSRPLVRQQYKQQPVVDVIDLDKLQQRHEQDKQNVAKIRQNMDSVVAQNA
ncbi:serine/arginine repetitive matrix protein 2-like [Haliotis asinina]|uniref:serine/arginine repetitive matrix protein 2-like n=1 Tax=Haliotis asinina TaxID=109174 RepID=UPI003531FAA1